jgi:lipoate-protein ligase A
MSAPLRVIDTGEMPARWNVATTAALTELHVDGRTTDILRFHRYPASVLVGRHQALSCAVNIENCKRDHVEIARRVTGGGAVYMAPGALAWDLIVDRRALGSRRMDAARIIGEAIATAFSRLGLDARYRPDNEIEVGGRKICGMSGYRDGDTIVCQGTALVSTDLRDMAKYLRLPSNGSPEVLRDLGARLTTVSELLGRVPGCGEFVSAIAGCLSQVLGRHPICDAMSPEEHNVADELLRAELGQDSFVYGAAPLGAGMGMPIGRNGSVDAYIIAKAQP